MQTVIDFGFLTIRNSVQLGFSTKTLAIVKANGPFAGAKNGVIIDSAKTYCFPRTNKHHLF